jgi:hypothetical protein
LEIEDKGVFLIDKDALRDLDQIVADVKSLLDSHCETLSDDEDDEDDQAVPLLSSFSDFPDVEVTAVTINGDTSLHKSIDAVVYDSKFRLEALRSLAIRICVRSFVVEIQIFSRWYTNTIKVSVSPQIAGIEPLIELIRDWIDSNKKKSWSWYPEVRLFALVALWILLIFAFSFAGPGLISTYSDRAAHSSRAREIIEQGVDSETAHESLGLILREVFDEYTVEHRYDAKSWYIVMWVLIGFLLAFTAVNARSIIGLGINEKRLQRLKIRLSIAKWVALSTIGLLFANFLNYVFSFLLSSFGWK